MIIKLSNTTQLIVVFIETDVKGGGGDIDYKEILIFYIPCACGDLCYGIYRDLCFSSSPSISSGNACPQFSPDGDGTWFIDA